MKDIFAVRNVDEKTRSVISEYARERNINTGDALRELISFAQEYIKEKNRAKKYRSIFTIHDQVKFSNGEIVEVN